MPEIIDKRFGYTREGLEEDVRFYDAEIKRRYFALGNTEQTSDMSADSQMSYEYIFNMKHDIARALLNEKNNIDRRESLAFYYNEIIKFDMEFKDDPDKNNSFVNMLYAGFLTGMTVAGTLEVPREMKLLSSKEGAKGGKAKVIKMLAWHDAVTDTVDAVIKEVESNGLPKHTAQGAGVEVQNRYARAKPSLPKTPGVVANFVKKRALELGLALKQDLRSK